MHTCLHECNTCFVYANQRVCIAYIRVCAHVVSMYMYVSTRVCVCVCPHTCMQVHSLSGEKEGTIWPVWWHLGQV